MTSSRHARKVVPIDREPTCYWVESDTLRCNRCNSRFDRTIPKNSSLGPHNHCPKCQTGQLVLRWHRVDIAALDCNGECGCERFEHSLGPLARGVTIELRQAGKYRCKHIDAAREIALDISLRYHISSQVS